MCKLVVEYQNTKSEKAYTQIFNKYSGDLKKFLSSKFNTNSQIIDDIVMMSFERARVKIDSYDPSKPFKTWFYTVARRIATRTLEEENLYYNVCFENGESDHEKTQSNNMAKYLLEQNSPVNDHSPLLSKIKISDNCGDDPLLNAYDSVLFEINNLKGDIRDVVIDSYLNNMTFEAIMKKYSMTESQVKLKLFTGRKEIRKVFHDKNVEDIKKMFNIESLKIPDTLNDLIQNKLKYCGELIVDKSGRGYCYKYIVANKKVNISAISSFVESHNKKVNKEIKDYTELSKMKEDKSYAKKSFEEKMTSLTNDGYTIDKEELDKVEEFNYFVSMKGIKTRNRSGNGESNVKKIKVEKLKTVMPEKLYQLNTKESLYAYITIRIIEKSNLIKIDVV